MWQKWIHILVPIIVFFFQPSLGSVGDISPEHQICLGKCEARNCSGIYNSKEFIKKQPWYEKTLGWSCMDECKYNCMWYTVDMFQQAGRPTPQFYGKWPFIRFLGIQDPASTLFSIFNLGAHVKWLTAFRQQVPASAPMYSVWIVYGLVSINAWVWSSIFHSRDIHFTEKMDYFSAFSIVAYSLSAFCVRYFGSWTWSTVLSSIFVAILYLRHIFIMGFINFDYGYNMKVNLTIGCVNSICWFAWFYSKWSELSHVRTGALAVFLLNISIGFEVLDFKPVFWIVDSHALWHLATAPIHAVWYKFVIQDCLYLFDKTGGPGRKII